MRSAGSFVIIVDGRLAGWLGRGEEQLLTFVADEGDADSARSALAAALAREVGTERRRALHIETVDGAPAAETAMAEPLRQAGFAQTPRGFLKRITATGMSAEEYTSRMSQWQRTRKTDA